MVMDVDEFEKDWIVRASVWRAPELADEKAVDVGVVGLDCPAGGLEGLGVVGEMADLEIRQEAEREVEECDERGGYEAAEGGGWDGEVGEEPLRGWGDGWFEALGKGGDFLVG